MIICLVSRSIPPDPSGAAGAPVEIVVPPPVNEVTDTIGRVVKAIVADDHVAAEQALAPIASQTVDRSPLELLPTLAREEWPAATGGKTQNPPIAVIAAVYARDCFTCNYCGRSTIPTGVLRLVSRCFPEQFPYHPHWKRSATHKAYWDISTSIDHVHAVSMGGDWDEPANLATACARCQYQKSNLSLELLGWRARRCASSWDGLTRFYRRLWERAGSPAGGHQRWIAAFEARRAAST